MNIEIIDDNSKYYPQMLLEVKNRPKKIYCLGNIDLLNKDSIAIVGSRNCSSYGKKQAERFSKNISKNGVCIISGMARGIDAIAHTYAMNESGKTIAVLGGGFNNVFPEENKELFFKIIRSNSLIISEYEPNAIAYSTNFPKRNRIISGISLGTLVIEAKYRSGSTITAKYAQEQGKKVFSLPSNVDSYTSVGTNWLIKEKKAILVTSPNDILKELDLKSNGESEEDYKIEVEEEYKPIYNLIVNNVRNINEIRKITKIGMAELNEKLTMLELDGYIIRLSGNEFAKK